MADSSRRTGDLTSYTDLARQLERLPDILRDARRAHQVSMRQAAEQIGIASATVSRIESGGDCALSNAILVLRWLDRPAADHG